jgi:hypothetical protein
MKPRCRPAIVPPSRCSTKAVETNFGPRIGNDALKRTASMLFIKSLEPLLNHDFRRSSFSVDRRWQFRWMFVNQYGCRKPMAIGDCLHWHRTNQTERTHSALFTLKIDAGGDPTPKPRGIPQTHASNIQVRERASSSLPVFHLPMVIEDNHLLPPINYISLYIYRSGQASASRQSLDHVDAGAFTE